MRHNCLDCVKWVLHGSMTKSEMRYRESVHDKEKEILKNKSSLKYTSSQKYTFCIHVGFNYSGTNSLVGRAPTYSAVAMAAL